MKGRAQMLGLPLAVAIITCKAAAAFSIHAKQNTKLFRIYQSNSNNNDDDFNPSDAIGGDLVTALARLDRQWDLATTVNGGAKKIGEWTVIDLKEDDSTTPEIVYLLEPASGAAPSCVIFFLGGAVLGQFPHISYSTFLKRVAERTNAAVVAIPYEVGLDHFSIAQKAVSRMKGAVVECEDSRGYPSSLPKYAIGHSLGCKLHTIGVAATGLPFHAIKTTFLPLLSFITKSFT